VKLRNNQVTYGLVAVFLHWLVALTVAGMSGLGYWTIGLTHYDAENLQNSSMTMSIDTSSVDSNHAERDKHLRDEDFLYTGEYPQATFKSIGVRLDEEGEADIMGILALRGVTREIVLDAEMIGYGADPWGGYHMGFEAETELRLADFGISTNLGPASEVVTLEISVEGVRQ
jgi:polyisoprenoid-binding protein YceI